MSRYTVRFTREAEADLLRLFDFLVELDCDAAGQSLSVIREAIGLLELFPYSCRKAAGSNTNPPLRELIIPFGDAGYVALFEIDTLRTVTLLAIRHQREDDYL